jgi:hypothetical protein
MFLAASDRRLVRAMLPTIGLAHISQSNQIISSFQLLLLLFPSQLSVLILEHIDLIFEFIDILYLFGDLLNCFGLLLLVHLGCV